MSVHTLVWLAELLTSTFCLDPAMEMVVVFCELRLFASRCSLSEFCTNVAMFPVGLEPRGSVKHSFTPLSLWLKHVQRKWSVSRNKQPLYT